MADQGDHVTIVKLIENRTVHVNECGNKGQVFTSTETVQHEVANRPSDNNLIEELRQTTSCRLRFFKGPPLTTREVGREECGRNRSCPFNSTLSQHQTTIPQAHQRGLADIVSRWPVHRCLKGKAADGTLDQNSLRVTLTHLLRMEVADCSGICCFPVSGSP